VDLEGVESLRRRGESISLHVDELVGEDRLDYGIVIGVMGEVHENYVGADVRIFSRMEY
jgi:hypothetical protein